MKSIRLAILLLLAPAFLCAQAPMGATTTVTTEGGIMTATTTIAPAAQYNPSRLFVKFRNGSRGFLPGSANARAFSHHADTFLVDTPPGLSVADAIAQYRRNPNVEFAEPDYIVNIVATPNDTEWSNQWDMVKIAAPAMWDTQTSASSLIVAVIDTGVLETHPDLAANVLPGWNCLNAATINSSTGLPYGCRAFTIGEATDDHGHGTHVAGTIGAVGNNSLGIAGINWTAQIMGFKFLGSGGSGSLADAVYAFNKIAELKQAGANFRVTNNSWGGGGYSQTLKDALAAVEALGIVNVCAAGNSGQNADFAPMYPAGYDNRGIVSVLASDVNDIGAGFTNYGVAATDIAAPGVSTISTVPTGTCSLCDATGYKYLSGTSMASPHVAGAVAAMMQKNPALTNSHTARDILLDPASYDVMTDAKAKSTSTGGRLNLAKLLANSKLMNPPAQLNNFPTITMGANIFAAGNQLVSVSASGSDPDPADTSLRFSFGKSGAGSWLFGSMLYGLFPIPPAGSSSYNFTTPMVGRTAVETYLGAVTDNRGGGASGKQFVTVSPVATTLGAPDGTFSVCDSGTANCASSGGIINVLRNDNCGTVPSPIPCAIVAVNYNPVDPDGIAGSVLWDSWYSTYGSSGGTCCYSGTFMNRGLTGSAASAFRISVNSVDRYLETSPTTTAGRKTAIVRVDGATTTPPLAQLSADVVSGPAPLTVNFSMAGTQAFDGKTIQWYFMGCGEGFLYGKTTPTHVCNFANPGTYWIQNSTSDSGGLNDVVNMYIVVTPPGGGGGDTTAPSVNITAPAAGNVKGSINLVASATDNVGGTGMNNVKFYLDSIANPMLGQVNGAGPGFTLNNWNSAGASNGTHTLLAVATDNSGNAATSAGVSILIDNAGPTVNITAPTAGSTVSGTVAINATANDNGGSGVAGVDFRVDGVSIGTDTTAPYTVNWNSTGSSNAGHIITAVATDVLGNSTTSASVNVTVNNITPAPAFGTPGLSFSDAVVKKANVTITANVTGGVAPVTVTFYINDVAVGTPDSAVPYTYNWKVPNAPNRTYTIRAVATDSLGRSTNSPLPNPSFNP